MALLDDDKDDFLEGATEVTGSLSPLAKAVGMAFSAYTSANRTTLAEIGDVIAAISNGLKAVDGPAAKAAPSEEPASTKIEGMLQTPPNGIPEKLSPQAASRLVQGEFIISPIDGKKLKSLRRHVSIYFASEGDFKRAYGLKADWPMVAPAYSAARSAVAKSLGLGRKPGTPAPAKKAPTTRKAKAPAPAE